MKFDPSKNKERYESWKRRYKEGIPGVSKANFKLIMQFLSDMEKGMNIAVGSKKGSRSYIRLNFIRTKMCFFARILKQYLRVDPITRVTEEQIHTLFTDMRNGKIRKNDNKPYEGPNYFAKAFKAFWHWHMKVQKKKGKIIPDITIDLDTTGNKPKWVYLTEEQIKKLCNKSKFEYKVLMMFLLDTGIRAPTELLNVKVSDFYENFKKLMIREETSKTFGRKINLMISSELIKEYVEEKSLKVDDFLFTMRPFMINRNLQRLAKKILGKGKSPAGQKYSELTMYDFRHSSACYWLPRYKSESALKYRFGWKKSDMIHYYTDLLGMRDTIAEEDLLVDVTKTEIEQRLTKSEKEKEIMREEMDAVKKQMAQMQKDIDEMLNVVRA